MTATRSIAQVLKAIGNHPKLSLYKGYGYFYFTYDALDSDAADANGVYETESVYTCYLNQLPLDTWVNIGKSFIEKCENQL